MTLFNTPALHKYILPLLKDKAKDQDYGGGIDDENDYWAWFDTAEQAVIFDCRGLPMEFVRESGVAAFEEHEALKRQFKLPYSNCYFEFLLPLSGSAAPILGPLKDSVIGVLAAELPVNPSKDGSAKFHTVEILPITENVFFHTWTICDDAGTGCATFFNWAPAPYPQKDGEGVFFDFENIPSNNDFRPEYKSTFDGMDFAEGLKKAIQTYAYMIVGAVSLLSEKLLFAEHHPDPAPKLTKARAKQGKPPVTSEYYVLKVNVAAMREQARKAPIGTHESPLLHWRRGHWRVLHRGSEFESKTWIRKCLVGDPGRGFAGKSYRLVKEQPLLPGSLQ